MQLDVIIESKVGAEQFRNLGLLAEQLGFGTIWISNYARAPDAFMTAVPLALASSRIGIGIAVICAYEMHPLKIANATLTLNELSGGRGRVILGGGGEWPGVMGRPIERMVRTAREGLEILHGAFNDEVVNYDGEVFKARGFSAGWAQRNPPALLAGASGPQMLRMAARIADGIMTSDMQPEMFGWSLPALKEALVAAGRDDEGFEINNFLAWHVKADREASLAEARRELIIRGWLERPWLEPYLDAAEVENVLANRWPFLKAYRERSGDIDGVDAHIVDTLVDSLSCAGGPETIDHHIEKLHAYAEAGFTHVALGLQDDPAESMRMVAERVMPALREAA